MNEQHTAAEFVSTGTNRCTQQHAPATGLCDDCSWLVMTPMMTYAPQMVEVCNDADKHRVSLHRHNLDWHQLACKSGDWEWLHAASSKKALSPALLGTPLRLAKGGLPVGVRATFRPPVAHSNQSMVIPLHNDMTVRSALHARPSLFSITHQYELTASFSRPQVQFSAWNPERGGVTPNAVSKGRSMAIKAGL